MADFMPTEPSMMGGLLDFIKTPAGQGLLSAVAGGMAGARRGQPINSLGKAGLAGVIGYGRAQDNQREMEQFGLQKQQIELQMAEQLRLRQAMENYRGTVPEADRAVFDVAPQEYVKNSPQFQKPTLEEFADPKDPLRKVKAWVRPGQAMEQGSVAGYGSMPEILDPRIEAAKVRIAQAGRSNNSTVVKLPAMENEENKALGKDLAEQYSGIQKAGMSASGNLNNLNRMKTLMTGIETGKLTPAMIEVSGVLESLGIKIDPRLPQKQAVASLSNELALRAKNQGGENLMPGAMSNPDRHFLTEMVPSLANTPGGNAIILETLTRKAKRDQDVSRMARKYRDKNKTLNGFADELATWSEQNPLFGDLMPTQGAAALTKNADGSFNYTPKK